MVLDTDTYNEIDDQFALIYSLLSPERLTVEAVYAAPFHNRLSEGPGDGMEKSYEEILRLLERMEWSADGLAFRGSTDYLRDLAHPHCSAAVEDLIRRALASEEADPLFVVAIGCITNVASALLLAPDIARRIVVVWLGGQPLHFPSASHFNLRQDYLASRLIFDCGVPLVHVPCDGVASHMLTTLPEMEAHLTGQGAVGEYLLKIYRDYRADHYAAAKEIWDVAAIAYLVNPEWVPTDLVPSPILAADLTWALDQGRHLMANARFARRNPVFADLFRKLEAHARRG